MQPAAVSSLIVVGFSNETDAFDMVEVPAAAVMASQFAREADFFSIGTNDLTQYTLAMDRGHPKLAPQVDGLSPGVLHLIAHTVKGAHGVRREVKWPDRSQCCRPLLMRPYS